MNMSVVTTADLEPASVSPWFAKSRALVMFWITMPMPTKCPEGPAMASGAIFR
jgi:hypothetical protein